MYQMKADDRVQALFLDYSIEILYIKHQLKHFTIRIHFVRTEIEPKSIGHVIDLIQIKAEHTMCTRIGEYNFRLWFIVLSG